jgi:hypothetical protein
VHLLPEVLPRDRAAALAGRARRGLLGGGPGAGRAARCCSRCAGEMLRSAAKTAIAVLENSCMRRPTTAPGMRVAPASREMSRAPQNWDVVDRASFDSFPASDPPGWIWSPAAPSTSTTGATKTRTQSRRLRRSRSAEVALAVSGATMIGLVLMLCVRTRKEVRARPGEGVDRTGSRDRADTRSSESSSAYPRTLARQQLAASANPPDARRA